MTKDKLASAGGPIGRRLLFPIVSAAIVACPDLHATVVTPPTNEVVATVSVGQQPTNLVVGPHNRSVFVANTGDGSISKIDTRAKTVVATWLVGLDPAGLAVTPNGKRLYVGNVGSGTVMVLNTDTGAILNTITVGVSPAYLAISPNGQFVYVPCEGAGSVYVIDTKTLKVATTIAIGNNATSVAFTPDSSTAYVTDPIDKFVDIIDTATASVTSTLSTNALSFLARINPQNPEEVFVLNGVDSPGSTQTLTIIESGALVGNFGLTGEFGLFAVTPNGNYAYAPQTFVNNGNGNNVLMFDTSTGQTVGNAITVGNQPAALVISASGKSAYVANVADNTVSLIRIRPAQ